MRLFKITIIMLEYNFPRMTTVIDQYEVLGIRNRAKLMIVIVAVANLKKRYSSQRV